MGGLQSRFLPQNYGYAGAISAGSLEVEKGRLVLRTPEISLHHPLPFYTCDSASHFAARELTRLDIQTGLIDLNIPISPADENGSIGHKVCLAYEAPNDYVIGLASPIDKFLGTHPFTLNNQVPWIANYFSSSMAVNPFHRSPNARIIEEPSWQLHGIDPLIRPLMAKNLADGRLAIAEMGLGSMQGYLFFVLVARIMRFDSGSKSAVIEWNDNLYLQLPVSDLVQIRNWVCRLQNRPPAVRELLDRLELIKHENRVLNHNLNHPGRELLSEAWLIVIEFLSKLPAGDIQTALTGN